MGNHAKHPVKTTMKTLELIDTLKELESARVSELADHVEMGKSAVHNHLSTLEEYEYVTKSEEEYSLGLRFLDLGGHVRNRMKLYKVAEPEIESLATETSELVNLAVEDHGHCVYLYRSKGTQAVKLDTYSGLRTAMHNTALGKSMLAHLPEYRVEKILDEPLTAETSNSITDPEEIRTQLAEIRERGYALDNEERLEGLRCVAAPIQNSDESVIGAISVSGPTSRMKGERLENEIPELVSSAANVIQLNITHS
ncbi:IclR family transcriptional regulator [Halobacteria archaeon AArc-curdl1]|uniref:IclR family transcriptional regulator n=1 Tax=Natronosalvus hydrolyticus TaxID=2979988 RepID=A0AAP2Z9N3_9EURY|nr:IclR family transcriptional regulator [Halobacteria archaeon AArc-curdl1]